MKLPSRPQVLLTLACWLASAGASFAQQPDPTDKRYLHFPPDGDLQQILQAKLQSHRKALEVWQTLLDAHKKDPRKFPNLAKLNFADLEQLAKLQNLKDGPELREKLQDLKIDPKQIKQIKDLLKQAEQNPPRVDPDFKALDDKPTKNKRPGSKKSVGKPKDGFPKAFPPKPLAQQPAAAQDQFSRLAEKMMNRLDNSGLGERLAKSSTFQDSVRDLQEAIANGKFDLPSGWSERLQLPKDFLTKLPGIDDLKIPDISVPSMSPFSLDFRFPRLDRVGGGLPSPGRPDLGESTGLGLLWVALGVLAALLVWQILRQRGATRAGKTAAPTRSDPWPVNPARVSTPAELILAFEHLAVLQLGWAVRSSHHRAIANGLAGHEERERRRAADELASLYEQVRYDPAGATLEVYQVEAARRDLCLLAGAAAA